MCTHMSAPPVESICTHVVGVSGTDGHTDTHLRGEELVLSVHQNYIPIFYFLLFIYLSLVLTIWLKPNSPIMPHIASHLLMPCPVACCPALASLTRSALCKVHVQHETDRSRSKRTLTFESTWSYGKCGCLCPCDGAAQLKANKDLTRCCRAAVAMLLAQRNAAFAAPGSNRSTQK